MLRLLPHPPVSELSSRQRGRAIKRTISPRLVKRVIRQVRPRARACPMNWRSGWV